MGVQVPPPAPIEISKREPFRNNLSGSFRFGCTVPATVLSYVPVMGTHCGTGTLVKRGSIWYVTYWVAGLTASKNKSRPARKKCKTSRPADSDVIVRPQALRRTSKQRRLTAVLRSQLGPVVEARKRSDEGLRRLRSFVD